MPLIICAALISILRRLVKCGYADYSTSNWARKESALTQAEQDAIEAHGLFTLSSLL